PLVICDPDFDFRALAAEPSSREDRTRGRFSRDLDDAEYRFDRLPATGLEGERISKLLGASLWEGMSALEVRLKQQCRSPRILHLATHGFFREAQRHNTDPSLGGIRSMSDTMIGSPRLSGPLPENPLLRSGLALTGANTWLRKGILPAEAED